MPRKEKGHLKKSQNKEFARVTWAFVLLFLVMMGYLVYFNLFRAADVVNNPFNPRQDVFAERVIRGRIVDRNGHVLARTEVNESGVTRRNYPYGAAFGHVIGYSLPGVRTTFGLEMTENFTLLTSNSFFLEQLQNDFLGRKNIGDTVETTLDLDLQLAAVNALGGHHGAVLVMEANSGRIRTMVSAPSFDPNTVDVTIDALFQDEVNSPLLNRVTQGLYAPGSIFKTVTLLEYMRQVPGYQDFSYQCFGSITMYDTTITCFNHTAHGWVDVGSAFAHSCNGAFIEMGLGLNLTDFQATGQELLFNQPLPTVLESSRSSFAIGADTGIAERMMTAMGQGYTMVSPYHMGLLMAAIANDGVLMEPFLVERVSNHTGSEIRSTIPQPYRELMTASEAGRLREYMRQVVTGGTGIWLADAPYVVGGKTGTAEVGAAGVMRSHSWFMGYADIRGNELVIVVVIEGLAAGDETRAVPLVRQILDAYYNR